MEPDSSKVTSIQAENNKETNQNNQINQRVYLKNIAKLQQDSSVTFFSLKSSDTEANSNIIKFINSYKDSETVKALEIENFRNGKFGLLQISPQFVQQKYVLIGHVICLTCFKDTETELQANYKCDIFASQGQKLRMKSKVLPNSDYLHHPHFYNKLENFCDFNSNSSLSISPNSGVFSTPISSRTISCESDSNSQTPSSSLAVSPNADSDTQESKVRESGGSISKHNGKFHKIKKVEEKHTAR